MKKQKTGQVYSLSSSVTLFGCKRSEAIPYVRIVIARNVVTWKSRIMNYHREHSGAIKRNLQSFFPMGLPRYARNDIVKTLLYY
jgi:hypothetical protein